MIPITHRPERLAETIKQEISDIVRDELKDPRIGFTTITRVDVSPDLRHAKVHVSIMGEQKEQDASIEALQKAKGFIRSELGNRIRLRHVPELNFILDHSIDHGVRIMELIDQIRDKDGDIDGSGDK